MFPLYSILDVAACDARGLAPLDVLDAFLRGGAKLVQLRDKTPASGARLALADEVVRRCRSCGAHVLINDFVDVASMSGADGVHLGQDDLAVEDARRILGAAAHIGISTHGERQIADAAATSASYIAVGPIFSTATKDTGYTARGLHLVRHAAATGKPVVAIGGITLEQAPDVIRAGASAVAVISDLLAGADLELRTRQYLAALRV
ncbi:MAG TPA: thiamine phosphate synthase [Vicinamibacterales bacterium]|nr:thiamine phosphate synthase [Vicinamibacterales bacterium]